MNVTVRFFASLRESTGTGRAVVDVPEGARIAELVDALLVLYPALDGHQESWHFAVNKTSAEPDKTLHDGDQVAIFPYIAGG